MASPPTATAAAAVTSSGGDIASTVSATVNTLMADTGLDKQIQKVTDKIKSLTDQEKMVYGAVAAGALVVTLGYGAYRIRKRAQQ